MKKYLSMHKILNRKLLIMIKKILVFSITVLFFAACGNDDNNSTNPSDTTEIKTSELTKLSLTDFDSLAKNFVGKEVAVEGIVDHVCKHGGKKLLLVDGDYNLHVFNDNRFDEALSGSKVTVTGIVEEERVDSAYLAEKLKHEEGSTGEDNEVNKEQMEQMVKYVKMMQDSLKKSGKEYFANYSLKFVSLKEDKEK